MNVLPDPVVASLFRFARYQLRVEFGLEEAGLAIGVPHSPFSFRRVNVTLRGRRGIQASMSAGGKSLEQAVKKGIASAVKDRRFRGRMVRGEVDALSIELLIQQEEELLSLKNPKEDLESVIQLGVDGVRLVVGDLDTHYKPSVPLTHGFKSAEQMLRRLSKKGGLKEDAWESPEAKIYRSRWLHYVESDSPKGFDELFRLRRRWCRSLTKASLTEATLWSLERLMRIQRSDGAYTYLYDPMKGERTNKNFNFVRMAGTTYSMCRATEWLPEGETKDRVAQSAEMALGYLFSLLRDHAGPGGGLFVSHSFSGKRRHQGRLGTSALALFGVNFEPFSYHYPSERRELTKAILGLQEESGRWLTFFYHKGWTQERSEETETPQNFFPGEALSALSYALDDYEEVFPAMALAFPFYRDHFRAKPATAFVLWQVEAWVKLSHWLLDQGRAEEAKPYSDFVLEVLDWVLPRFQGPQARFEDWVGGVPSKREPVTATTGCVTEALIRGLGLAARLGDERVSRYREVALRGLTFLMRAQIEPCETFVCAEPELALGGLTRTLVNWELRNDQDQHAITAWIAALETPALRLPEA